MKRRHPLPAYVITLFLFLSASVAFAHGLEVTYRSLGEAIEITGRYDTGTPVGGAVVEVFAPDEPATPFLQGETDSGGVFVFAPDRARPGQWMVRIRQEGHGGIIYIPVERWRLFERIPPMHALAALATGVFLAAALLLFLLSRKKA